MNLSGPNDYLALLPPLLMAIFGCATLLLDVCFRHDQAQQGRTQQSWFIWFHAAGQGLVGVALYRQWLTLQVGHSDLAVLAGSVRIDGLALFTNSVICFSVLALLLMSYRYLDVAHENNGEYYALVLFAQCGMYFMAAGDDLISLFVGIELTAISFYILTGFTRREKRSNEAALKYLLLGAVSSGFILYGFSLLYGVSGSTALADVEVVLEQNSAFGLLATVTVLIGLLLKVSAAPFHNWAPDAYEGAPTPITGYLAVASKIAAFAVLIRLLSKPMATPGSVAHVLTIAAAILSITVGSISALTQQRLKRLFAYSGVAHSGYVLLGLAVGARDGVLVYLLVYAVMNLGAFALLVSLRRQGVAGDYDTDLRGLSRKHPIHAALFAVLLLSLAGIPPTAGFIGKYVIFAALIQAHQYELAVVAAAYVVVSLFFYFRLVREMYLEQSEGSEPLTASFGARIALGVMSAATLWIGLFPEPVLRQVAWFSELSR